MTETDVWRSAIRLLDSVGASVVCGCPPGATSYIYKNCTLNKDGKIDAPDIMFVYENVLYICECKGNFLDLVKRNNGTENDFEKVRRLSREAQSGGYNDQVRENFLLNLDDIAGFAGCVAFFGSDYILPKGFSVLFRSTQLVMLSVSD